MKRTFIAFILFFPLMAFAQVEDASKVDSARVWFDRGIHAFFNKDNPERQLECYTKAIEYNPDYSDAYRYRATTFFKMDRFEEAIKDCDTFFAVEQKSDDKSSKYVTAIVHFRRAESLTMLGQYKQAKKDYDKAVKLMPHIEKYAEGLKRVEKLMANKD